MSKGRNIVVKLRWNGPFSLLKKKPMTEAVRAEILAKLEERAAMREKRSAERMKRALER